MCSGGLAHMEWSHKLHPSRSTGCTAEWNNAGFVWCYDFDFFFFLHQDGETAKWKHSFTELCLRSFYCSLMLLSIFLSHIFRLFCVSCLHVSTSFRFNFFLQCFGEVFPSSLNSWIHKIKKWIKNYLNRTWQQSQKIHNLNKLKNRWETQL